MQELTFKEKKLEFASLSKVLWLLYLLNIGSLIWARLFFFKINSPASRKISYLNDTAAAIQIIFTFYLFYENESGIPAILLCILLYLASLVVFWWSISTTGSLDFASSSHSGRLYTKGPYSIARHPFYLSYSIIWITSTTLLNEIVLWASLVTLLFVYYTSAKLEEATILESSLSAEYIEYMKITGMFWPKFSRRKIN